MEAFCSVKTSIVERLLALIFLALLTPLVFLIALVVGATSNGPVLYRSLRIGQGGKPIHLLKFRSMVAGVKGPQVTVAGDVRITRVGKFLRKTKLDELPQLWNVIRGDMKFVGARPEDPLLLQNDDPSQAEILKYLPGLTGPASILYRDEERLLGEAIASGEDPKDAYKRIARHKRELDLEYLGSRTRWEDLGLIFKTMQTLLTPKRLVLNETDSENKFLEIDQTYHSYMGEYASRWDPENPGNMEMVAELQQVIESLLDNHGVRGQDEKIILDLGCGSGGSFSSLLPGFFRVSSDLLIWRLLESEELGPSLCNDGTKLPLKNESVDVVFLSTVLSSVGKETGLGMFEEISRVLSKRGILIIYDFRIPNPKNRKTRPIRRRWVKQSLSGFEVSVRSVTVWPQLARRLGEKTDWWYPKLSFFPFFRSHNVIVARLCDS